MAARGDVRFELFEAEDERETLDYDILDKIIKQLEYYFGDKNLSRDKFLQRKLESGNGWVEIDVLLTFNKLRSLTYKKWTVSAAFYWKGSQLLEISRDETKVRRKPAHPWPRRSRTELDELTVFVKGFPLNTCTDELDKFFGQFGQSVDVFMMCHNKTQRKFNEMELTRAIKQTRHAIRVKKDAEYEALAEPAEELKVVPGCLLRVTGLDKVTTWKSLKEALEPYAKVAFVDYCESKGEAVLRFIEEGAAHAVLTKLEQHGKGLHIDGNRVIVEALEAGEEVEYWKKLAAIKRKLRNRRGRHNSRSVQRGKKRRSEERSISPDNMME
ncbi:hypothetical protein HPB52_025054 [Rhipicephalus sanguineus]|uniref:Uncharacterized protein n=1 Tax=Rhipicephalus sanguineus TaxID=34632 RepID=A0A9D4SMB8_RHISA|nr:hypothetical protein HPB52_025054 [Rhipicephalus sanguineus]